MLITNQIELEIDHCHQSVNQHNFIDNNVGDPKQSYNSH